MTRAASRKPLPASKSDPAAAVSVAEAKANFSSLITRVEQKRSPVTILRRGVPVAQVIPIEANHPALFGSMRGTVQVLGDIVGPTGEEWILKDA